MQAQVQDLIGQSLTLAEPEHGAQYYRERGWCARVYLPEQDVTDGGLRIQVLEGRYDTSYLTVQAGQRANAANVQRVITQRLVTGAPLPTPGLERGLLLANDLPGIEANGLLQACEEEQGHSDLLLTVLEGQADTLLSMPRFAELQPLMACQALTAVKQSKRVPDVTVSVGSQRNVLLFGVSVPLPVSHRNQGNLLPPGTGRSPSRRGRCRSPAWRSLRRPPGRNAELKMTMNDSHSTVSKKCRIARALVLALAGAAGGASFPGRKIPSRGRRKRRPWA